MNTTARTPTIFVVDDNPDLRECLCLMLEGAGMTVKAFPDGESFLADFDVDRAGCLLIDQAMPGLSGLAVFSVLRDRGQNIPTIVLSGSLTPTIMKAAVEVGVNEILEKPIDGQRLLDGIRRLLER